MQADIDCSWAALKSSPVRPCIVHVAKYLLEIRVPFRFFLQGRLVLLGTNVEGRLKHPRGTLQRLVSTTWWH